MFIKLLDGPFAGQTLDIGNEAAQGLLAQGRAMRAFQDTVDIGRSAVDSVPPAQPGGTTLQPAPRGDDGPTFTLEQTDGKKKKSAR